MCRAPQEAPCGCHTSRQGTPVITSPEHQVPILQPKAKEIFGFATLAGLLQAQQGMRRGSEAPGPRLKGWVSQASSLPVTLSPLSPRHATVAAPGRCVSAALAQWSREPQGGYEERVWVMGASTQTGGDGMGGVQHTKMGGVPWWTCSAHSGCPVPLTHEGRDAREGPGRIRPGMQH